MSAADLQSLCEARARWKATGDGWAEYTAAVEAAASDATVIRRFGDRLDAIEREAWSVAGADTCADALDPIWTRVQLAADVYFAVMHARAVAHYDRQCERDAGHVSLARWGKAYNADKVASDRYQSTLDVEPQFRTEREKIDAAIAHERAEGEFRRINIARCLQIHQIAADRKLGIVRRPLRHRKHVRHL
jgi:hypothetical protein